jgi:hypothetical protein
MRRAGILAHLVIDRAAADHDLTLSRKPAAWIASTVSFIES